MALRKPLVIISGQTQELPAGDSVAIPASNGGVDPIIASFSGTVAVATGTARYYHPSATTITSAYASLGTASSSGSVVAVVKLNGSTTVATLTITSGSYLVSPTTLSQAITPSDYLTINITSAGTGAADLTIYIVVDSIVIPTLTSRSVDYTTTIADANIPILHPSADTTARTWTIDSNANVAYPISTELTFINQDNAGVLTIAIATDIMRLVGSGSTGNRTLAANGYATAKKLTATEWQIRGWGLT